MGADETCAVFDVLYFNGSRRRPVFSMSDDESSDETPEFEPGYVLQDRYEVRQPLGQGGFATVYETWDTTIERRIALKVLNLEELARGSEPVDLIRKRFLREARLSAKIRHPSVIEIYDFGVLEESEQPYMMMEFLEGKDLDEEIKELGCIPADRLLPLFVEALEGLGEAHEQGVVHKDLKPANLFLTRPQTTKERLKVVDFGIAHVHEDVDERLTKTGAFTGTPFYLPQEYLQDQAVRPEMDVYQMGLILIEALSGQRVIAADTAYQAAIKHIQRDFRIAPGLLEGELGEVIEQSIAHDPDDRFEEAGEFARALDEVDPAGITFQPREMDTAAAGAVTGTAEGPTSSSGETREEFGGADVDAEASQGVDGERPISESLGIETINAAFGSTWPLKVLIVLGVAIVATIAVLGVVVVSGLGDEEPDAPQAQPVADEEPGPDRETGEVGGEADDSVQEGEELVETVVIESNPAGASVETDGGDELGGTPVDLEIEEGETRELTVDHPDYEPEELTVEPGAGDVEVALEESVEEQPAADDGEPADEPVAGAEPAAEPGPEAEVGDEPSEVDDESAEHREEGAGDGEEVGDGDENGDVEEPAEEEQEDDDWAMPGADDDDEDDENDDGYRLAP